MAGTLPGSGTAAGPGFGNDAWAVSEAAIPLDSLPERESIFALANGHIGIRGTLDEGEPTGTPGTYLNGFYEERPLPYAEAGYGYPEAGQTTVSVPDGTVVRPVVDDAPFDLRYGEVRAHRRSLDLRRGLLHRCTDWVSPEGRSVRVTSQRLVSFARRTIAAVAWEVSAPERDLTVAVQSDLLANQRAANPATAPDPRAAAALATPLAGELAACREHRAVLVHRTRRSGLTVAAGMDHSVEVPAEATFDIEAAGDLARLTVAARLPAGTSLRLFKFLAYGWSSRRSSEALRDQVEAALAAAALDGWDGLMTAQASFLDRYWSAADVEVDGDPELQQALRFALFAVLQAGARGEQRPIPAKGLTGPGYDGHVFWDMESAVLPVLTYTAPDTVRDALRWRHSTLGPARERATLLGQRGAAFPWRTIRGEECSGYWPAGTASFHVGAGVADAVVRYLAATGDDRFEAECGTELLAETARLWMSLGHFDGDTFRIHGVTGPDEYTAVVDDNVYTNLMAERNLREAAASADRQPDVATRLGVSPAEPAGWRRAAAGMAVPYDTTLGVHPASAGFTTHAEWDFDATPPDHYPLFLFFPYFELYRKQVVKQADLVLALHKRGDAFSPSEKERDFAYYEARTVRDSSLSATTQAVIAAEVGHLELAYRYWAETATADLGNLYGNTASGLHIGALAGAWTVAVAGFGGMRDHDGRLTFAPRLPPGLDGLRFRLLFRGRRIAVDIRPDHVTYSLLEGPPLESSHHGEAFTFGATPATRPVPPAPAVEPVTQPPGRPVAGRRWLSEAVPGHKA